jgi:sigma-E factor negative regulatory protein RseC
MGGGKEMEVEAVNMAGAKAGDRVVIGFETASLIKASFLVYVFPVLCMIAGAAAGQEIAPNYGLNASLLSAVAGFGCFFLAFLAIRFMGDKMSEKDKYQAKVIRIKRFRPSSDDELKTKE